MFLMYSGAHMKTPCSVRFLPLTVFLCLAFVSPAFAAEPQWVEIKSPNFSVYTDSGEKRGREIALRFEQMRFAFGTLFKKAKVQTGAPVRVIAFRNSKGFRTVTPLWKGKARENLSGYYLAGDSVAFVALDLSSPQGWTVVFHEFAHLLLNSNVQDTPVWFDEGFAEFYSTTEIGKNEWVIGQLPEYAPQLLNQSKFIPLSQLFSAGHDSPLYNEGNHVSIFYAESWLAVEYFWFTDPGRQKQLLDYLNLSKQMPVPEAMKRAFGKDPAQLDKDFEKFFREGKATTTTYKKPPAMDAIQMTATTLDDVDAQATVAELRINEQDHVAQARAELESILQKKPDQPVALRALGYAALRDGDMKKAESYFERAMKLGPQDPRVYVYWAMAVQSQGAYDQDTREELRKALEKAIALDPQISRAHSLLAFVVAPTDFDAAMKSMKTAITLDPRRPENYLNAATLYMNRGKFDDAAQLLKQLLQNPDQRIAAQARSMLDDVEKIRKTMAEYGGQSGQPVRLVTRVQSDDDQGVPESFSGTLEKIDCQSPTKIVITVTGKEKLVLSGDTDEMMVTGKVSGEYLSCDLKGVKVHGHYDAKRSTVLTLVIE